MKILTSGPVYCKTSLFVVQMSVRFKIAIRNISYWAFKVSNINVWRQLKYQVKNFAFEKFNFADVQKAYKSPSHAYKFQILLPTCMTYDPLD